MSKSNYKGSNKDQMGSKPKDNGRKDSGRKPRRRGNGGNAPKPQDDNGVDGYNKTSGSNDFAWHCPEGDQDILRRASKLSWAYQAGEVLNNNVAFYSMSGDDMAVRKTAQSGIMVIKDLITVGGIGQLNPTTRDTSLNLPTQNAANTLLTEMRSRTRVRNTYNAPDVMMENLAMAHIYAAVSLAKRLAATARLFSYQNHYMPEILLSAQGFHPGYFKAKQFEFVTELNVLISEINKIYVPNRMHLFQLIAERFENYYTEGSDVKDQIYVITPAFLSSFELNPDAAYASCLKPCMVFPGNWQGGQVGQACYYDANHLWTGEDLLNCIRYMLSQVLSHDEWADIAGDMENAFGPSERWIITSCNPEALALPIRDEEILEMIHNMSWSDVVRSAYRGYSQTLGTFDPTFCTIQHVTDNSIGTYDLFRANFSAYMQEVLRSESTHRLIDVHEDPNDEKTFAITRLRNITGMRELSSDNTTIYVNVEFATDLICGVEIYTRNGVGPFTYTMQEIYPLYYIDSPGQDIIEAAIQPFHYRPLRPVVDATSGKRTTSWVVGETDIYSQIPDAATLRSMNRISLLSLLGAYNNA